MSKQVEAAVSPISNLFHVVDIGDPSKTETCGCTVSPTTASTSSNNFAYFNAVESAVANALKEGVDMSVLFLNPEGLSQENRSRQAEIFEKTCADNPAVDFRFSGEVLPWRGMFVDPSMFTTPGRRCSWLRRGRSRLQAAVAITQNLVRSGYEACFDLIQECVSSSTGN